MPSFSISASSPRPYLRLSFVVHCAFQIQLSQLSSRALLKFRISSLQNSWALDNARIRRSDVSAVVRRTSPAAANEASRKRCSTGRVRWATCAKMRQWVAESLKETIRAIAPKWAFSVASNLPSLPTKFCLRLSRVSE